MFGRLSFRYHIFWLLANNSRILGLSLRNTWHHVFGWTSNQAWEWDTYSWLLHCSTIGGWWTFWDNSISYAQKGPDHCSEKW